MDWQGNMQVNSSPGNIYIRIEQRNKIMKDQEIYIWIGRLIISIKLKLFLLRSILKPLLFLILDIFIDL